MSDIHEQLKEIRQKAEKAAQNKRKKSWEKRRKYRTHPLDKFAHDLRNLRETGASYRELTCWLLKYRRFSISPNTIRRYLLVNEKKDAK
ncbi:MAG: hypothetical protein R8L53_08760 [Mariprofundales bacterium]